MKKASFWEKRNGEEVRCGLCNHHCVIASGRRGICGVRENMAGELQSLVYGRLVSRNSDPVEKKPLFHFLPGSISFSIATVGCNFRCRHCQNWQISQYPHLFNGEIAGDAVSPQDVVSDALASGARSIAYTYVEPTIFYEMAKDTAELAHREGIKNIFVSNGYMAPDVSRDLATFLDGINIDLKAFTDRFYKEICGARLQPVMDNIALMYELGVWVEVTTLVIPGWNDSEQELRDIARFIKGISSSIPWHVSAFYPTYKLTDSPPTPASTLIRAREIGLEEGLRFVYQGNIPGAGGENTNCPSCGTELISRRGYLIMKNRIKGGKCPSCGETIEGVWE